MSFLYILSWVSLLIHIVFVLISIAAGLYYMAEIVEEYTQAASKLIRMMISATVFVYIMFIFFDNLPWKMILCGFAAQIFHAIIMSNFPFIRLLSFPFVGAVVFLVINHILAFQFFTSFYYPFMQVLAYFTICLWMVPISLFVSLNANDNVLPTTGQDVVTNYFNRGKKQGLLSLFSYAKDSLLPTQKKKPY
ncbi:protein TEX261 isoform X2 [Ceratitis capitata]|uniref:protein TEX261 isoform X2 n=1 Tax=Ceratitis capitata TaxID=7213 RepID=UPI000A0FD41E|nr:protein TEX261 isoform X2 [Ceratitis capitata]